LTYCLKKKKKKKPGCIVSSSCSSHNCGESMPDKVLIYAMNTHNYGLIHNAQNAFKHWRKLIKQRERERERERRLKGLEEGVKHKPQHKKNASISAISNELGPPSAALGPEVFLSYCFPHPHSPSKALPKYKKIKMWGCIFQIFHCNLG
jgi:hypothetical protein